jgi:hypothetical protein
MRTALDDVVTLIRANAPRPMLTTVQTASLRTNLDVLIAAID